MMRAAALLAVLCTLTISGPARAQATGDTLTLRGAARTALESHPLRGLPLAERDRAAAGVREARAAWLPRLSTEWAGTQHQEPMIVRPLHGFDPMSPPEFDRTLVQGGVSASWLLFDGGARGARLDRAGAAADVAEAGVRVAESDLLARVATAYLAVLDGRDAMAAYDAQIAALESERTRVLRFEAEGRAARVDVLRAEAALSGMRADRAGQDARRARAEADLGRLIGVDAARMTGVRLVALASMPPAVPDRAALLSGALEANPRVAQARMRVAAADAARREARAAWLPSIALASRYNAFGTERGDFTAEWQGGVQLSYPLFTGGQRSAAVERAEAERAAARHSLRLTELEVESALDDALTSVAEADARAAALDDAVAQYRAVVEVEQLLLAEGAGVQTDYLRATASLLDAVTARSAARHARLAARVRLAQAAGVLTLDWLDDNLMRSS